MMHTSKVLVVDGTLPHVSEPRFPSVCQEIVGLGQYWDKAVLEKNREKIIKATELNKSMMAGASNYNKALGLICDDTYTCAEGFADRKRIEEAAWSFCDSLFENLERKTGRGRQSIRQLSVMTRNGYTTLQSAAGSCSKLYILDDEISTILMTSNPLTKITNAKAEHIDCSVFYDKDQMQPYEKHFAANHALMDTISGASREMLEDAKLVHDEMEKYYISAMDFEALDGICEKICEEIEQRRHR